jgi:hypothetical protein
VLTYFLNDFEMVPVAPIITGITLVFTFHIRCISIVSYYYYYYYFISFSEFLFARLFLSLTSNSPARYTCSSYCTLAAQHINKYARLYREMSLVTQKLFIAASMTSGDISYQVL